MEVKETITFGNGSGVGASSWLADGGAGNDAMTGGDGTETFRGGLGNDNLMGGLVVDTFKFDLTTGIDMDTLPDFNVGAVIDTLEFSGVGDQDSDLDVDIDDLDMLLAGSATNPGAGGVVVFNFTSGDSIQVDGAGTGSIGDFTDFEAAHAGSISIVS